jgi:Domain of unknown function (DUF5050)
VRKAWAIICCALCLVFLSFPLSGSAASKEIYYTVKGNEKVAPGIYKAVPNGKAVPVLKEKNYKMKEVSKPPVRLEDANLFFVNERTAQAADYKGYFEINNQPIRDVQVVGKDLYFTKLLVRSIYAGGSCGGGGADILEIYKRSSNGKIAKVTNDKVSSDTKDAFKVIGSYIYYAKVENEAMGNFTIIKSTLDGKKKQILYKGVEDFWIHQNQIYFIKDGKLYSMGIDGKGVKNITPIKAEIYGDSGCDGGNYSVSDNGFSVTDYSGEKSVEYYLEFTSKKVIKLPPDIDCRILDVDSKKNRFVGEFFDGDQHIVGVYDFKGKLLRKLKAYDPWTSVTYIYSVNAKSGQLLYVEGTSLKEIKF